MFKTSSHPNLEVGLMKHEESNTKLPVFFCLRCYVDSLLNFGCMQSIYTSVPLFIYLYIYLQYFKRVKTHLA